MTYSHVGSTPEEACFNLETVITNTRVDGKDGPHKYSNVIVTIGGDDVKPIISSPRAHFVDRIALAKIDGKDYNVTVVKNNNGRNKPNIAGSEYIASLTI